MPRSNHHKRAGKRGGQATKAKYGDDGFYQEIGSLGGQRTMALHGDAYGEIRRRAGETTKARYGQEHYQQIAAQSAQARQAANALRDEAIQHMLDDGWKIPTIINLTWEDIPELRKYLDNGLGEYLAAERPDTESEQLFVSRSGKPLGLANTYAVMARYRERCQE
jgi:general stress protein YciG